MTEMNVVWLSFLLETKYENTAIMPNLPFSIRCRETTSTMSLVALYIIETRPHNSVCSFYAGIPMEQMHLDIRGLFDISENGKLYSDDG